MGVVNLLHRGQPPCPPFASRNPRAGPLSGDGLCSGATETGAAGGAAWTGQSATCRPPPPPAPSKFHGLGVTECEACECWQGGGQWREANRSRFSQQSPQVTPSPSLHRRHSEEVCEMHCVSTEPGQHSLVAASGAGCRGHVTAWPTMQLFCR